MEDIPRQYYLVQVCLLTAYFYYTIVVSLYYPIETTPMTDRVSGGRGVRDVKLGFTLL